MEGSSRRFSGGKIQQLRGPGQLLRWGAVGLPRIKARVAYVAQISRLSAAARWRPAGDTRSTAVPPLVQIERRARDWTKSGRAHTRAQAAATHRWLAQLKRLAAACLSAAFPATLPGRHDVWDGMDRATRLGWRQNSDGCVVRPAPLAAATRSSGSCLCGGLTKQAGTRHSRLAHCCSP